MSLKRYIKFFSYFGIIFAFGTAGAGVAQALNDAPHFTVETAKGSGIFVTNFVGLPFTGVSTGSTVSGKPGGVGKLEVPGLFTLTNPATKCSVTGTITGSLPDQPGASNGVVLTCSEVTVEGLPKCTVNSPGQPAGTIVSNELTGDLVWLNLTGDTRIGATLRSALPAGTVALIEVSGATCVVKGSYALTLSVVCEIEEVTKDTATGKLECGEPPITNTWNNATPRAAVKDGLLIGGKAAAFTNTFDITLTTSKLWGVEPG
jgi:hypothetical protein